MLLARLLSSLIACVALSICGYNTAKSNAGKDDSLGGIYAL